MKCGCSIYSFLNFANLICQGTDISKFFTESLALRDNESRLYNALQWFYCLLFQGSISSTLFLKIQCTYANRILEHKNANYLMCLLLLLFQYLLNVLHYKMSLVLLVLSRQNICLNNNGIAGKHLINIRVSDRRYSINRGVDGQVSDHFV